MGIANPRQGLAVPVAWFAMGAVVCYTVLQLLSPPGGASGGVTAALAAAIASAPQGSGLAGLHSGACPAPREQGAKTRNVVFAAVGDDWNPSKWGWTPEANWDLVAVYYGTRSDWGCPECVYVIAMPDTMKWQMLWRLMDDPNAGLKDGKDAKGRKRAVVDWQYSGIWKDISERFDYIMVADDDMVMDACVVDTVFGKMRERDLLVAMASNCRSEENKSPFWVHWQLPGLEMHYVNVIDAMAPAIQMQFLQDKLAPLLEMSYAGWGLPFCFGSVSDFPQGRLAVIDSVCMVHPYKGTVGPEMGISAAIRRGYIDQSSVYARFKELTPYESPRQEQSDVWKECKFTADRAKSYRQLYPPVQVLHGHVLSEAHAEAASWWSSGAGQQLLALASGEQPLARVGDTLVRAGHLAMVAAAGAAGALFYSRRAKGGLKARY